MPCYTISEANLDLKKADLTALKMALKELGYLIQEQEGEGLTVRKVGITGKWNRQDGLVISGAPFLLKQEEQAIKQAYTGAVVNMTAKRMGWQVQKKGENQYMVQKR
jgi:hypothetical protein